MEFLVTLGSPGWGTDPSTLHNVGSVDQQEGTFMHELGHNLGLGHGGFNSINCKPNYLSVMTYTRQLSSLIGDRPLDYSRSLLLPLNEQNLFENLGIAASTPLELRTVYGPPPIVFSIAGKAEDWNRDGDTLDVTNSDINSFSFNGCSTSPNQILRGFDDWKSLKYISLPIIVAFAANPAMNLSEVISSSVNNMTDSLFNQTNQTVSSAPNQTISNNANLSQVSELTMEDVRQQRIELLAGINSAINSLPNTAFKQSQEASTLKGELTSEVQNKTGSIADLLQSDKLDEAIGQLNGLKGKMDSSFGGFSGDDLIIDTNAQQQIVPLVENLILVLEKQK